MHTEKKDEKVFFPSFKEIILKKTVVHSLSFKKKFGDVGQRKYDWASLDSSGMARLPERQGDHRSRYVVGDAISK